MSAPERVSGAVPGLTDALVERALAAHGPEQPLEIGRIGRTNADKRCPAAPAPPDPGGRDAASAANPGPAPGNAGIVGEKASGGHPESPLAARPAAPVTGARSRSGQRAPPGEEGRGGDTGGPGDLLRHGLVRAAPLQPGGGPPDSHVTAVGERGHRDELIREGTVEASARSPVSAEDGGVDPDGPSVCRRTCQFSEAAGCVEACRQYTSSASA